MRSLLCKTCGGMHPAIQNAALIEAPGIPYVRVLYAFCGFPVTQQEFDTVLHTLNRLAGSHYVQDDIADVQIQQPTTASSVPE